MLVRLRQGVVRLLRLNASPHGVAFGFTLGLGLSLIPIPFLGMFVALALAPVVGASLPAVYAGTAVVNPLTGAAFYFAELWLGTQLTGDSLPSWATARTYDWRAWWALVRSMLPTFLLGAATFMAGATLVSYPILRALVAGYRRRHPQPDLEPEPASEADPGR